MSSSDFAGPVDVEDGRRIFLECAGSGGPAVILESGYGHSGRIWTSDVLPGTWLPPASPRTTVFDGVAGFTRVCCYDRPGTLLPVSGSFEPSRSDPAPMPRTVEAMVDDLHATLHAADLPSPYVFVGHSLGGSIGRAFDARYPGEIHGMVLVDAFSGQLWTGLEASLTPDSWAAMRALEEAPRIELQAVYPEVELLDLDLLVQHEHALTHDHPLSQMPLMVLTRGKSLAEVVPEDAVPAGFRWEIVEQVAAEAQRSLAELVPGARHVVVQDSGHLIQLDRPDAVIAAIREVVDAARAAAARLEPVSSS